jgi:hypothetical protein
MPTNASTGTSFMRMNMAAMVAAGRHRARGRIPFGCDSESHQLPPRGGNV